MHYRAITGRKQEYAWKYPRRPMSEAKIATLYEEIESIRSADALYWQREKACSDGASAEYLRRQRRLLGVKRELAVLERSVHS
jgi:hypothetical protein